MRSQNAVVFPKWKTFGTMRHENKAGGAFLFILAMIRCTANCVSGTHARAHPRCTAYGSASSLLQQPPPLQITHFNCLFPSRFIFIFNYLSVKLAAPPCSCSGNDAVCRHCGPLASSSAPQLLLLLLLHMSDPLHSRNPPLHHVAIM